MRQQQTETYMELVNDCGHDIEDLSLACVGHITVVVDEDGLEQRRHHVGIDHFEIVRSFDICVDEFQDLLLDRPETSDLGGFRGNAPYLTSVLITNDLSDSKFRMLTVISHGIVDELARRAIHVQHVMIDAADL